MSAILEGPNRDIAAARKLYEEIRNVLEGERSNATPQDLKVLCISFLYTIRDPYCQEKMCEVALRADELFDGRTQSERRAQPGAMFLRRLILNSLESVDDRLRALETTQSSGTNPVRSLQPLQSGIRRTPTLPPAPAARS